MRMLKTSPEKAKRYSLRSRSIMLMLLPFLLLFAFFAFYMFYAISIVKDNSREVNEVALDAYINSIDESMNNAEKYILSIYTSSDLLNFCRTESDVEFYKSLSRLQTNMTAYVQTNKFVDSFFVYAPERAVYFDGAKYALGSAERNTFKELVISCTEEGVELVGGKWIPRQIGGQYYFLRFFNIHNAYLGCIMSADRIYEIMLADGYINFDYLSFFAPDGRELGNVFGSTAPLELKDDSIRVHGRKYMAVSSRFESGDFSAVAFISRARTLEGLASFSWVIVICLGAMAAFIYAFTLMMRRWITAPIDTLCSGMNDLKNGNLDIKLSSGEEPCTEFVLLNEAFDDMSSNIKQLKIDVYEQNLRRQEAELQYMKAQFKPHFYINCFNAINNLAIMNRTSQISEMTKYLGNEMRYIMGAKTVDTLGREVEFTENYLRIQELCYGDSVQANFEIEPSVRDVSVPPLIILTFVGNVYKHQATPGETTDVYVVCSRCEEDENRIRIEIWDSGEGFSEEMLRIVNCGGRIVDERGEHFGIKNIISRVELIYGDRANISFSNHEETGGAYIVIELPDDGGIGRSDGV